MIVKILITIISLFLIISNLLLSSYVLFQYSLFKINQKYISENLCVQKEEKVNTCCGSCYLKKNVNNENEESSNKFVINELKTEFNLIIDNSINFKSFINEITQIISKINQYKFIIYISIFHPPN